VIDVLKICKLLANNVAAGSLFQSDASYDTFIAGYAKLTNGYIE